MEARGRDSPRGLAFAGAPSALPSGGRFAYPPRNATQPPIPNSSGHWTGDGAIAVAASGGDVPAFTAWLTFPSATMVSSPVPDPSTPVAINRATEFVATWTSPSGDVVVEIDQVVDETLVPDAGSDTVVANIRCVYPGSAGRGAVPPSVLAALQPSPAIARDDTTVSVYGLARGEVVAGDWRVALEAVKTTGTTGCSPRTVAGSSPRRRRGSRSR